MAQTMLNAMNLRSRLAVIFLLIVCIILPSAAHVLVTADGNTDIRTVYPVEIPTKSYVMYGHLPQAGESAWYQLRMKPGDRLVVSLMTPGYNASVLDMIVMSPGTSLSPVGLPLSINVPEGYFAEIINGGAPRSATYEPFSPAAVFEVASYSRENTPPGLYYVVIVSSANETSYSIAVGYVEELTPLEWVLVPVNVIITHLWEGQSILVILTPFLAVVIFGFIVISRRESRKGPRMTYSGWLATIAGLCYLGGAAITVVQVVRAIAVTGLASSVAVTLVFAIIPMVLGIWVLRIGRQSSGITIHDRIFLVLIAILGSVFWAGLVIGPVIAIAAAAFPEKIKSPPEKMQGDE